MSTELPRNDGTLDAGDSGSSDEESMPLARRKELYGKRKAEIATKALQ